jgi:hypothetical protein
MIAKLKVPERICYIKVAIREQWQGSLKGHIEEEHNLSQVRRAL